MNCTTSTYWPIQRTNSPVLPNKPLAICSRPLLQRIPRARIDHTLDDVEEVDIQATLKETEPHVLNAGTQCPSTCRAETTTAREEQQFLKCKTTARPLRLLPVNVRAWRGSELTITSNTPRAFHDVLLSCFDQAHREHWRFT